jgi:mono/diheme cytochrome c family protein
MEETGMRAIRKRLVAGLAGSAAGLMLAGCAMDGPVRGGETQAGSMGGSMGGSVARGAALAQAQCASCHAVERMGDSPNPDAPPFRRLSENYPVANLQEGLAEGLVTAHPGMPEFAFEPDEIRDLIAYLETL